MNELYTDPESIPTTPHAIISTSISVARRLEEDEQIIEQPTVSMVDRLTGEAVTGIVSVLAFDPDSVTVKIDEGLVAGRKYRVEVLCVITVNKVEPILFNVECVEGGLFE